MSEGRSGPPELGVAGDAQGPLSGLRVVEFAGIGPGPHCAMLLSDLGAEVVRIERPEGNGAPNPIVDRGRAWLTLDLASEAGRAAAIEAASCADVLIEGYRPGVMERLGLGPGPLLERNPRLIYGRLTGWGQDGPLARSAGHDINYIALTGALAAIGRPGEPAVPPLNLVGDYGGGSMLMAFGIMAALYERDRSGRGQVIDAAIIDGVTSMMTLFAGMSTRLPLERAVSPLGGAAPFYRCYLCADGKEIAVGALEPKFYARLIGRIGAPDALLAAQYDSARWETRSALLADLFLTRTAAQWCELMEGSDACFAPVLSLADAPDHPHFAARDVYIESEGLRQAAPVPRFSRTAGKVQPAADGRDVVARWKRTAT